MQVFSSDKKLTLPSSVITIGALDGVHRGHQELLARARSRAKQYEVPLVVYTFDIPPRVYFNNVILLTSLEEKLNKIQSLGADYVIVASFNKDFIKRDATSFLDEIADLHPVEIWEGADFHFGRNKEGNIDVLRKRFKVEIVESLRCETGVIISSSLIRNLYINNKQSHAERLLGWKEHDYFQKQNYRLTI